MSPNQRGMASVEAAVLVPSIFLLACLIILGARLYWAKAQLADAASSAARNASVQGCECGIQKTAREIVASDLAAARSCRELKVHAARADGYLSVDASCRFDLGLLGGPSLGLRTTASEKIDTYRSSMKCDC